MVKILEIRFPKGSKATKAFVDIDIDGIKICDFRVIQNIGKAYVKAPFTTYKDENGELHFRQIVDLPAEVRGRIDNAILSTFYREMEKTNKQRK